MEPILCWLDTPVREDLRIHLAGNVYSDAGRAVKYRSILMSGYVCGPVRPVLKIAARVDSETEQPKDLHLVCIDRSALETPMILNLLFRQCP